MESQDSAAAPHRPERTCIGCRRTAARDEFVRLTREELPDGHTPRVRVDPHGTAPGRGAWIHPDADCLDLALRRGGPNRAFRSAVDTGLLARDLEAMYHPPFRKRVEEPMDIR